MRRRRSSPQQTARGRQLLKDVDAYIAGINAYFLKAGGFVKPYTRNDVTAIGTLIGAVFGAGGGNEARSAQFLSALQQKLGAAKGLVGLERPARAAWTARRR